MSNQVNGTEYQTLKAFKGFICTSCKAAFVTDALHVVNTVAELVEVALKTHRDKPKEAGQLSCLKPTLVIEYGNVLVDTAIVQAERQAGNLVNVSSKVH